MPTAVVERWRVEEDAEWRTMASGGRPDARWLTLVFLVRCLWGLRGLWGILGGSEPALPCRSGPWPTAPANCCERCVGPCHCPTGQRSSGPAADERCGIVTDHAHNANAAHDTPQTSSFQVRHRNPSPVARPLHAAKWTADGHQPSYRVLPGDFSTMPAHIVACHGLSQPVKPRRRLGFPARCLHLPSSPTATVLLQRLFCSVSRLLSNALRPSRFCILLQPLEPLSNPSRPAMGPSSGPLLAHLAGPSSWPTPSSEHLHAPSNILVSARYASTGPEHGHRLSRPAVTAALRTVVEAHSALRIVGVVQPSPKDDSHNLHIGVLHTIDLDQCIEFLDDVDSAGSEFFEQLHNKWDWFEEKPDRPWWRVYVVGGRDVVFVLHHLVADANSGMVFHRTFLRGLNSFSPEGPAFVDPIVTVDPNTTSLFPEPMTLSNHKPSIPELIWGQIKRSLINLVFGLTLLFSSLQPGKPYFKSIVEVAPPEMRTVTRVSSLRIPARKMAHVLAACKANGTTFTALLTVMLLATFSVDLYPQEKVGCSRYAFDIRPYIRMPKLGGILAGDGVMMNGVGGSFHTHWLGNYRRIVSKHSDKSGKLDDILCVDAEATWKLARYYRRSMQKHIPSKFMRSWMAGTLLGGDLESFVSKALESMGKVTSKSFLVSNLGAFTVQATGVTAEGQKPQQQWRIDDVQFSAATVNSNVGSRGFVFNVAGVKGGDTVVNVSYEEGVVSRGNAEDLLELTMDKIESLLESEQRRIRASIEE
ncbi:hypothetical protein G7Z17_g5476 [Cylindrodendrum hubeiense]|uniref:Uncharacterized protein n=1 Tax=Cylindrodendrum hubeiense TaxID=595255 RepID=A0A9P5HBS2_9HYPO|nr:hypothetical protein G7Z17_g5476 [Cylindrodendrum hubeiense]